ncbi:aspartate kinase [Syntrophomonas erecta]
MRIAVQKFGGTSLATQELRSRVYEIIRNTRDEGLNVVVVVSAMGRKNDPYATDSIINLVKEINHEPEPREMDIIMSCGELISGVVLSSQLTAMGIKARFFTGEQAGIVTDGNFNKAHILYVNPKKILECMEEGLVPVVAGFQGIGENGEWTTLGRGGSDTTASALGVALNAEVIDIFTDVEGVMTADPRIVDNARLLDAITYNELCQLAREGAKVVHPRAIEIAMQSGTPLRIRCTFSESMGTLITHQTHDSMDPVKFISDRLITGITYTSNIAQVKINSQSLQDKKGLELKVFRSLALAGISVDFINVQPDLIMFTVAEDAAVRTLEVLKTIGLHPDIELHCAKVAVVGAAMTGIPGVMAKVVEALEESNIPILQSGDSYTNIWCLLKREHMEQAVKALHDKFELGNK